MARTKAEIRSFLDSQVGKVPQHPAPYQDLSGQCVTLIKVLLDFLGVPNPYAARGNATDVDDTLLAQGIAQNGKGWLTIVVNHDMGYIGGVHYGHIWIDLQGEANYESNGAQALHTTKNTRPITQGQQFVNLDNWIQGENTMTKEQAAELALYIRLLAFESVEEANSHSADDVAHMLADPGYAGAIAKAVYSGEWQLPAYKAGHYDSDTKANYNKGYADGQAAGGGGSLPVGTYLKVDKADVIEVKETK